MVKKLIEIEKAETSEKSGVKEKMSINLKEMKENKQGRSEAGNVTPIRKKLVTDQKVRNIVRKFEPKKDLKIVEGDEIPKYLEMEPWKVLYLRRRKMLKMNYL